MTSTALAGFIALISAIVIAVTATAFVIFNRFLQKEKLRGERHDAMHGRPHHPEE